jgi:hypothetical protein
VADSAFDVLVPVGQVEDPSPCAVSANLEAAFEASQMKKEWMLRIELSIFQSVLGSETFLVRNESIGITCFLVTVQLKYTDFQRKYRCKTIVQLKLVLCRN